MLQINEEKWGEIAEMIKISKVRSARISPIK
jgi:hypothetical protein